MMHESDWLLLSVDSGIARSSIFIAGLAAQRMSGWESTGKPFQRLLDHNNDIPSVTSDGREIQDRDIELPEKAYAALRVYVANLPVVSYDLDRQWDNVLLPDWERLRIPPVGNRGFCAQRFARRLLDPVPTENGKLESLRQYYRLPERDANSALGDVETLADLFHVVLRPKAEALGLDTWQKVSDYAAEEWYPSRFAFGKFKGRMLSDAVENKDIRKWLEALAGSRNPANARIGAWYLARLERQEENAPIVDVSIPTDLVWHVTIFQNPEAQQLQLLVEAAQARLAEVEAAFSVEKRKVDALRARLFAKLREHYEQRDRLRLVVRYRKSFIEKLLHAGEEEANEVREEFKQAEAETKREYESTAAALAKKRELSAAEELELKLLWKQLVKLFHPDKFFDDAEKRETYQKLTQAINHAKDSGDIDTLREIASDPEGFIRRQGWATVELADEKEIEALRRLLEMLQIKIVEVIEATIQLKESPDYELHGLVQRDAFILETVSEKQKQQIEEECAQLSGEAATLEEQIEELTGGTSFGSTEF